MNDHAVSGFWTSPFDDANLRAWTERLRKQLRASRVSLGLVFMTPHYFQDAAQILEVLRVHAEIPLLIGCSSNSLVIGAREVEDSRGLVVALFSFPNTELKPVHFTAAQIEQGDDAGYWQREMGVAPESINGWLAFADPFETDVEAWLRGWNAAYAPKSIVGGIASGDFTQRAIQLYLDGRVYNSGGVAVAFAGETELLSLISQGCTPIGETWTITKADANFIHEIGNRPAYEVLFETFSALPEDQQDRARGNLFIGLVVNEYLEEFHRGDFLVRNILGGDPKSGSLAVGALPRQGQTLQFQRRDAAAATEDLTELLDRLLPHLKGRTIYGGCLANCTGRGHRLFGHPNHDAGLIQEKLGPMEMAGFFCNGELGPIGKRNFLHSYTASLALFASRVARV